MTGMETEEDAFVLPDDYGDGMVDHDDTGGDDMEWTEWSERAVGHAAQKGKF